MTFFKIFGNVAIPVPVKSLLSVHLREMYLLSNLKNQNDQNHMTTPILCHQQLQRIVLRLFAKRYISCLSFVTVPTLEKEMCFIVKVMLLRSWDVTITCGGVILWRIFSLISVWLYKFGDY